MLEVKFFDEWLKTSTKKTKKDDEPGSLHLGDTVDMLHCGFTVSLLCVMSMVTGAYHLGQPIDCMTSKDKESARWTDYVLSYCFVHGSYRIHDSGFEHSLGTRVNYYQWVWVLLLVQMVSFWFPSMIWGLVQSCLYIDMNTVVLDAANIMEDVTKREEKMQKVAEYVFEYFYYRRALKNRWGSFCWRHRKVATVFYLLKKFANLLNVVIQFSVICLLLGAHPGWGFHELYEMFKNRGMEEFPPLRARNLYESDLVNLTRSLYFPKVVRCDYDSNMGPGITTGVQSNPTQCLLTINYLNEKLFLVLYFWYISLITVTAMNIALFLIRWLRGVQHNRVTQSIILNEECAHTRDRLKPYAKRFTEIFLGSDGVLLLNFVHEISGSLAYHGVVIRVWELYRKKKGLFRNFDGISMDSDYSSTRCPISSTASVLPFGAGDGYSLS